jgi:hypothetical protein
MVCPRNLAAVCHLVYDRAPPTALDLRKPLCEALAVYAQQVVKQQAFMDTFAALPELCHDLFIEMAQLNQIMIDDRLKAIASMEAAVVAKCSADISLIIAEAKMKDMIREVNKAESCRHCGLENNVRFEHESLPLRCRCRTKY